MLGTASQVPGRTRNHNGYFLRWDAEGFLFDPGEGTQRQMLLAGVPVSAIDRICVTHFHGDHCLGLPGVVQRLSLDNVRHPVHAHYPASGQEFFDRLRHASVFHETTRIVEMPIGADGVIAKGEFGELRARRLDHPVESFGYQLAEPGGRRMLPELLERLGITGAEVGELQRAGSLRFGSRTVTVEQVSVVRRGQRFAFVMDTRMCDGVYELAERADLLVIEATFLHEDARLAAEYGHLTARQAAQIAAESMATKLVLTHFSQRYDDPSKFYEEAKEVFGGDVVVAADLSRVSLPKRG